MEITRVRMRKSGPESGVVLATASVQFDNCLVVHGIKLLDSNGKRAISFPNKKIKKYEYDINSGIYQNYRYADIVHPSNQEFREYVQGELFKVYDEEGNLDNE